MGGELYGTLQLTTFHFLLAAHPTLLLLLLLPNFFLLVKSWASFGPGDSGDPSISSSVSDGNITNANFRLSSRISAASDQSQIRHDISWRDEHPPGEAAPVVQAAGCQSPHQSRLFSYTQSSHYAHRSPLLQSYMVDHQFTPSPSQQFLRGNYSAPPQAQRALYSSNNEISPFGSTSERAYYAQLHSLQSQSSFLPSPLGSVYQQSPQSLGSSPHAMTSYQSTPHTPITRPHTMPPSSTRTNILNLENDNNTRLDLRSAGSLPTTPVRSTIVLDKQDSPKPLPQNLRGDPFRSAKVKTELCRFFNTEEGCKFGESCNYAHGEHELKFNKLLDLERAGLVDVEVFRCHMCFTWVATGSCPFDQRCTRLHDPRVVGSQPSWLPHAEILVNISKNEREIDKLYHQQYSSVYSCSPIYDFCPEKRWKADKESTSLAWREFYSFCCNMDATEHISQVNPSLFPPMDATLLDTKLSEMNRLTMALIMRRKVKARNFLYHPSHLFCGELCLVRQTCYFRLEAIMSSQDVQRNRVVEISKTEAMETCDKDQSDRIIVACEIAFGPVADASVHPVSIWFDINSDDIVQCTQQQAKRQKRSRHRVRAKQNTDNALGGAKIGGSSSIPPFISHQPMDDAAFDLITGIQTHRYRVLECLLSSYNASVLQLLALEEESLKKNFVSQRRFWMTWTWPKTIESSNINEDTDVPCVDSTYNFVTYGDPGYREDSIFFGTDEHNHDQVVSQLAKLATGFIWKSFVTNLQLLLGQVTDGTHAQKDQKMPTHDPLLPKIRRLRTFRSLSLGESETSLRILPRLRTNSLDVIREWRLLHQSLDDSAPHPCRDVKPDFVQRRPMTYSFEDAAHSWSRELPSFD